MKANQIKPILKIAIILVQTMAFAQEKGSLAYQGQTYKTVKIGAQTWMAENLNYNVEGSACYDCSVYGRLYDWATAMGISPACNSSSCSAQVSSKHQGICPYGWHIPTNAEWDALFRYADGAGGASSPYDSQTAGRHLKARSGWNNGGNGSDTYGFAALPGGNGLSDGSFVSAGYGGRWWCSSESGSYYAYLRAMSYINERAYWDDYGKTDMHSVRCIQD